MFLSLYLINNLSTPVEILVILCCVIIYFLLMFLIV